MSQCILDQGVEQGIREAGPVPLDGISRSEPRLAGIGEVRINRRLRPVVVGAHRATREDRREGQSAEAARSVLQEVTANPRHEFWPDNASYDNIPIAGIIGHRQVTDAYLAHLARSYSARLVTFDQALAKLHADVADLIPDT